jgi:predicted DCC family thiol-disulfide oxidoreductase YuxK
MGASTILETGKSIVFFDSHCLLCSRFVNILLKNDRRKLYYSGFESEIAQKLLTSDLRYEPQTIVFYDNEKLWFKSKAVFKIAGKIGFPWSVILAFSVLPTTLTDYIYNWIARNRISWFGRSEQCFIPDTEQKSRFFE